MLTFTLKNSGKLSRVVCDLFLSSKNKKVQKKVIWEFICDFKSREPPQQPLPNYSGPAKATKSSARAICVKYELLN